MSNCKTIAICNQKGGVGKTTTTVNLGVGLAKYGKRVLLVDADPQGDLTTSLGWQNTDELGITLATKLTDVIKETMNDPMAGILHHEEGGDLLPANLELSAMEYNLMNALSRETTLRNYLCDIKDRYDYILIDCMPSLGMIPLNALSAADSVIIPVQAQYLPAKGMTELIKTVFKVQKYINPNIKIDGMLLTLVDSRTNLAKSTEEALRQNFGEYIKLYRSSIPIAVKAAESSSKGKSIYAYDPNSTVSRAYTSTYSAGHAKSKYFMSGSTGNHQVYCIESGVDFSTGDGYVSTNGGNSRYFQNLPTTAQMGIMLTLLYGWHEGMSSPVAGTNTDDYAFATQTLLWEYQQLLRTSPTSLHDANGISGTQFYYSLQGRPAEKCYNWILEQTAKHYTVPSFASNQKASAQTYTLKYNPEKKNYSLTLTDTNNTLANIKFSNSHITVTRSGNQYTFTSDVMIENPVSISAQKNIPQNTDDMLIWGSAGKQTMCSGAKDPVWFYFNIKTETYGVGHIVKHSEDGKVGGISFTIAGNGVNKTVTTKADGTVDIQLLPGVYTVTEQAIDKYEPQSVQRVTIVSGGTSTVTFSNVLKRGGVQVIKSSEDGFVEGVKFHLYGTSLAGIPVDEYAVTDKNGVATFKNVLISGSTPYTIEEVDTAIRYSRNLSL